jgi:patatin-related protein
MGTAPSEAMTRAAGRHASPAARGAGAGGTDLAAGRPIELRLALVCYGGVSLAIYMHGVTKELHKLVDAARAHDRATSGDDNPFEAGNDSRHTYFEALRRLAADTKVPVSVNVDIIAGTSAGGINGICLAKVLARNGSQDALKELWLTEGDLTRLIRAPKFGGWHVQALVAAVKTVWNHNKVWAPLRGDHMSRLLYDAIEKMDSPVNPDVRSLIPGAGALELFVTTTDLRGFTLLVASGSGGASQRETEHAQVLQFRATPDGQGLGQDALGALAFGARATSSFPGAFPPVSLTSFAAELDGRKFEPSSVGEYFRTSYPALSLDATHAWFVDGGVLDNAPFDHVIDAIGKKRASQEVRRRLIYIQPDPGTPLEHIAQAASANGSAPTYLSSLLDAVVKVKGEHSILRELRALRDLNLRITEVATLAEVQEQQVNTAIEDTWGASATPGAAAEAPTSAWDITDLKQVSAIATQFYDHAADFVGAGYPAYCQLKVDATAALLASETAKLRGYREASNEAALLTAACAHASRARVDWNSLTKEALGPVLGSADVPYRERRLLFILAGVNALYGSVGNGEGTPTRAELDELKTEAWSLLEQVRAAPGLAMSAREATATVVALGRAVDADPCADPVTFATDPANAALLATLFDGYRDRLAVLLGDGSAPLWEAFVAYAATWSLPCRKILLSRYIGFPLWDALLFPTIGLSGLPQFMPITVSQFSPLAASALKPLPPKAEPGKKAGKAAKLQGVAMKHFGAFAKAEWRENDYLWGRLDAVELILRTLDSVRDEPAEEADASWAALLPLGLRQVLTSEDDLGRITPLRDHLGDQVKKLGGPPA